VLTFLQVALLFGGDLLILIRAGGFSRVSSILIALLCYGRIL